MSSSSSEVGGYRGFNITSLDSIKELLNIPDNLVDLSVPRIWVNYMNLEGVVAISSTKDYGLQLMARTIVDGEDCEQDLLDLFDAVEFRASQTNRKD